MKLFITNLLLLFLCPLVGQDLELTVTIVVTDATCSANGEISASATGGGGAYRYLLESDCGQTFPGQTSGDFSSLIPCDYQLIVRDIASGIQDTTLLTVAGNSSILSVGTRFETCDASIVPSGGAPPYIITYRIGEEEPIIASADGPFNAGEIGDETLTGTLVDQCGNSRDFELRGTRTAAGRITVSQTEDFFTLSAGLGPGPFTFTVMSDAGTFTNDSGAFTYDQIGCNPTYSVVGACPNAPVTGDVNLQSRAFITCLNLSEGIIEVAVSPPGFSPYQFEVTAGGAVITSSNTTITGIPTDATSVTLRATDACGNVLPGDATLTPNRLLSPEPATSCSSDSLILGVDRTCTGNPSFPVTIECLSCPGTPGFTLSELGETTIIQSPVMLGDFELMLTDNCGDQVTCTDSVFLELQPACDSIIATYVQQFTCDNGTTSRRPILDPDFRFRLFDEAGTELVADNRTGRFTNLQTGRYEVEISGSCASERTQVELLPPQDFDPTITVNPEYGGDGSCELFYRVQFSADQGPYELTSFEDPSLRLVLNNFNQLSCSTFDVPLDLRPGNYRLASLSRCAERIFELPDLVEERIDRVDILEVCPTTSVIDIVALRRTAGDWRAYFADLGLNAAINNSENDFFILNGRNTTATTIPRLRPGDYQLAISTGFGSETCPIDIISFVIPEYVPVELEVAGEYLCPGSATTDLVLTPRFGNSPYIIRTVDCVDKSIVLSADTLETDESITLADATLGAYCFVIQDDCGITTDFQTEVRDLNNRVNFEYSCEGEITLLTDLFRGEMIWRNQANQEVGRGPIASVPTSLADQTFTIEVMTDVCLLRAEVTVPGRSVVPAIDLLPAGPTYFLCGGDAISITAGTDENSTLFFEGAAAGAMIGIENPGTYSFFAINDLGCVYNDTITVALAERPTLTIQAGNDFCPGEPVTLSINPPAGASTVWSPIPGTADSIVVLGNGRYFAEVTDTNSCTGIDSFDLILPEALGFSVRTDSLSCFGTNDGAVLVNGNGGTGLLTYSLNGGSFENGTLVNDLAVGTYTLQLSDENGCTKDTSLMIGQPDTLFLSLGEDRFLDFGETVEIRTQGNVDTFTAVSFSPDDLLIELNERTISLRPGQGTLLSMTVLDSRGCPATGTVELFVDDRRRLYVPTAFSPNNDGVNDRFTLQGPGGDVARINSLQIFDRWGALQFTAEGIAINDMMAGWDGRGRRGLLLGAGTFVWQAEIGFFDGSTRQLSGTVNLIR